MQLKRVCKEAIVRSLFASISGRARLIAPRSRDDCGLLPRQLRSIDGMVSAQKKLYVFTVKIQLFTIDNIYTYTRLQNAFPNFEITPFGSLCETSTLPFNKFFWSKQGIYI